MTNTTAGRLVLTCAVLILAACLCVSLAAIAGAGYLLWESGFSPTSAADQIATQTSTPLPTPDNLETGNATSFPTETPIARNTGQATPEATTTPSQSDLSPTIARQMDEIQQQVILLRGLSPSRQVERALLTPEQLRQHVINDFLQDYSQEEAREDALVLAAFGLLNPDFDLYTFYIELYSEQIAGFYDDDTQEMYVIQGAGFHGPERLTYAHEYTHVLQDQTYDIHNKLNYSDEVCQQDSERCAALQALLEGDATLLEYAWLSVYATPQDLNEIRQFYSNYHSPVYDSAPDFMKKDFLFPYTQGQEFVMALFDKGEWQAVDDAYRDAPLSTEQILHPERYPDDKPVSVSLPDLTTSLGDGWRELDRGVMGEWYTYLILAHGIDSLARQSESQAKAAAEGWGGDAYVVYYNQQTQTAVMLLQSAWDSAADAMEFDEVFRDYATDRFGAARLDRSDLASWEYAGGIIEFHLEGPQTIWILAPDAETAQLVKDALP